MPTPTVIDAVIFDLDDTLIDWWGSIRRCLDTFAPDDVIDSLLAHCREHLWATAPDGDHIWHRNTWALHTRREEHWALALPELDPVLRASLMRQFDEELWVEFYPDTVPTLDLLVDRYRLAVLSNNHLLPDEVVRLRLGDWFESCHAALHPIHKPAPEAFQLALAALGGLDPGRCVYVGDSIKSDVYGSLNAGLIPVWHNHHGDVWPDRPPEVHEIATLADLPPLLASLEHR